MNSYDGSFFKYDKTFASDLYLIYKLSPSARVCVSDTDRLLMFYLVLINHKMNNPDGPTINWLSRQCDHILNVTKSTQEIMLKIFLKFQQKKVQECSCIPNLSKLQGLPMCSLPQKYFIISMRSKIKDISFLIILF